MRRLIAFVSLNPCATKIRTQANPSLRASSTPDDPLAEIETVKSLDLDDNATRPRAAASRAARTGELRAGTNVERGERTTVDAMGQLVRLRTKEARSGGRKPPRRS